MLDNKMVRAQLNGQTPAASEEDGGAEEPVGTQVASPRWGGGAHKHVLLEPSPNPRKQSILVPPRGERSGEQTRTHPGRELLRGVESEGREGITNDE